MVDKKRIYAYDNLKFFMIICVVIGHMCGSYVSCSNIAQIVYTEIYSFHMPVFAFISGLFSKKMIDNKDYFSIGKYLALYFVIEVVNSVTKLLLNLPELIKMFNGEGVEWFALCLFVSAMLMVFFKKIRKEYVIVFAILFSCFAGYDTSLSDYAPLFRIIRFFPFYALGYYTTVDQIEKLKQKKPIFYGSIAFILVNAIVIMFYCKKGLFWPLAIVQGGSAPYVNFCAAATRFSWLKELLWYAVTILLTYSFCIVTPDKNCVITKLGSRSMQVYVFHMVFLEIIDYIVQIHMDKNNINVFVMIVIAIVLGVLLALPDIKKLPDKTAVASEKK